MSEASKWNEPVSFGPSLKNRKLLGWAKRNGFELDQVINDLLGEHLEIYLRQRKPVKLSTPNDPDPDPIP
jgi:hypothetical protein